MNDAHGVQVSLEQEGEKLVLGISQLSIYTLNNPIPVVRQPPRPLLHHPPEATKPDPRVCSVMK